MIGSIASGSLVDRLDRAESRAAKEMAQAMESDAFLDGCAAAWRAGFGAARFTVPAVRDSGLFVPSLPRGGAMPGSLSAEYPTGLFHATRLGWAAAVRALAVQDTFTPGSDVSALSALAIALDRAAPPALAPTPSTLVAESGGFRLRRIGPAGKGEPVVVLSSLVNRWYILDLLEGKSFLSMLASLGRPLFVIDCPEAARGDDRSLGDLCAGPVRELICLAGGRRRVALVGYCMGGTLAAILAARYPDAVSRLATVCAPVSFSKAGSFARWLDARRLDVESLAATHDAIPAWLVHLPFWWLRPTAPQRKLVDLVRGFGRRGLVESFLAIELWGRDHADLPRGAFRGWVGDLYQRDLLVRGGFAVGGKAVSLARIRVPLLVVSGEADPVVPPASAESLLAESSSKRKRALRLPGGHVDPLISRAALARQREAFAQWLKPSKEHR